MNTYSASPYPLLDGNNGADTPGAFFFRRKNNNNNKTTPSRSNNHPPQSTSPSTYEPSLAPSNATTLVPDQNDRKYANIPRPTTPPQGSRSAPWSSYRDLPSGHPVFAYSEEMREESYQRGIDPVVQAELDAAKENRGSSSADGRAKGFWRQSASRLKTFAAC